MNMESEFAWYRGVTSARGGASAACLGRCLVGPDPGHAVETANGLVPNLIECRVGEVQVRERTFRAAVGDGYGDRLALVCRTIDIS